MVKIEGGGYKRGSVPAGNDSSRLSFLNTASIKPHEDPRYSNTTYRTYL
jgi:hypothetical protein